MKLGLRMLVCLGILMAGAARAMPTDAPDSLTVCDRLYAEGQLTESLEMARAVLEREPGSYGAAWMLSRALISSANLEEDKEHRYDIWLEARAMAERAVELDPEGTRGYTCLAVCTGSLSKFAKGGQMIELAELSREAAVRAIDLDDRNDLAFLVLGIWNREIATVGGLAKLAAKVLYGGVPEGASLETSEECLRRAVALAPSHINHHRELAITLWAMDRLEEAIAELETAVSLEITKPEDGFYAANALELLEEARLEWEDSQVKHW